MTDKSRVWWAIFPVLGININNKHSGIHRPMFGDSTLISRNHIPELVRKLRMNERMAPGYDHEKDAIFILNQASQSEEFHSFIAVRRSGRISPKDRNPIILEKAKSRAIEVVSLLSIVLFSQSAIGRTCGLLEHFPRKSNSNAMLEFKDGGFRYQMSGDRSPIIIEDFQVTRSYLRDVLHIAPHKYLFEVLIPQTDRISKSLRRSISQSTIMLAEALIHTDPSLQLVNSVISLEMLLSGQSEPYHILKNRIHALLNENVVRDFRVEEIINNRHLYVHQGRYVSDYHSSFEAIILAITCLLIYCEFAVQFKGKSDLLAYLDFLSISNSLRGIWSRGENNALRRLKRQRKSKVELPMFDFQDGLRRSAA